MLPKGFCFLFSSSCKSRFFPAGSEENKKNIKLSVLSGSAVNNSIQAMTLLGSQIKPHFLGVVVDSNFNTGF
jgi:hypothetical protein